MDPLQQRYAEAVRGELIAVLLEAYEDAGIRGLCGEGRFEAAVESVRQVDLTRLVINAVHTEE